MLVTLRGQRVENKKVKRRNDTKIQINAHQQSSVPIGPHVQ